MVSSIDTFRGEAFFVEHSLIDKTRIQHVQFFWRKQTYFGIISFTQLHLFISEVVWSPC